MLAAISPTYCTFLEQARDVRPSCEVLDALAGALSLSGAERAHLHRLVHGNAPEDEPFLRRSHQLWPRSSIVPTRTPPRHRAPLGRARRQPRRARALRRLRR